jgi:hypothetical protein
MENNKLRSMYWLFKKAGFINLVKNCEHAYQSVSKNSRLRIPRFQDPRGDKKPEESGLQHIKIPNLGAYNAKREC